MSKNRRKKLKYFSLSLCSTEICLRFYYLAFSLVQEKDELAMLVVWIKRWNENQKKGKEIRENTCLKWVTRCWRLWCDVSWRSSANQRTTTDRTASSPGRPVRWNWQHIASSDEYWQMTIENITDTEANNFTFAMTHTHVCNHIQRQITRSTVWPMWSKLFDHQNDIFVCFVLYLNCEWCDKRDERCRLNRTGTKKKKLS